MHVQVLQKKKLCNGFISSYMPVTLRRSTLPGDPKPRNSPLPETTIANTSFPQIFLHASGPHLTLPPPHPTWPPVSPDFAPPL